MTKILGILGLLFATTMSAQAALLGAPYQPEIDARFDAVEGGSVVNATTGLRQHQVAVNVWDYSLHGGSSTAASGYVPMNGTTIPANALITRSYIFVSTQVTGTVDTGGNKTGVAFHCTSGAPLAILFPNNTTLIEHLPTTRYAVEGTQTGASTVFTDILTACTPKIKLVSGNLTAGKITLYTEYVLHP